MVPSERKCRLAMSARSRLPGRSDQDFPLALVPSIGDVGLQRFAVAARLATGRSSSCFVRASRLLLFEGLHDWLSALLVAAVPTRIGRSGLTRPDSLR
jgi:hypothetical protein